MKSIVTIGYFILTTISSSAFAFGGLKRHFMRPPHTDCIGGRFSHICVHHKKPKHPRDPSHRSRGLAPLKACKILESNAPKAEQLTIRISVGAKNINASTKKWNQTYFYDEEASSPALAVYAVGINHPQGSPGRIEITGMDDSEKDRTILDIAWDSFTQTIDCPVP